MGVIHSLQALVPGLHLVLNASDCADPVGVSDRGLDGRRTGRFHKRIKDLRHTALGELEGIHNGDVGFPGRGLGEIVVENEGNAPNFRGIGGEKCNIGQRGCNKVAFEGRSTLENCSLVTFAISYTKPGLSASAI